MFFNQQLLARTGPLGLIWIAGHFKSRKISKKKVLETDLVVVCEDLQQHIQKFALPVRASLVLGASIICLRKTTYLQKDADDLKKRVFARGRLMQVEINMKEAPPKNLTLDVPRFHFNHLLLDIDFGLLDETAPEIDYEQMRQNMADPNAITLRETVITRKPLGSDEIVSDFPIDDAAEFAKAQTQLDLGESTLDINRNASNVGAGILGDSISETVAHDLQVKPQRLNFDESAEVFQSPAPAPRAASVLSDRVSKLSLKLRRKKLKVDRITQIPTDTMKANIANVKFHTRKINDIVVNYVTANRDRKLKMSTIRGAGIYGPKMTAFVDENMQVAQISLDSWSSIDEEDPFGWCGSGIAAQEPERLTHVQPARQGDRLAPEHNGVTMGGNVTLALEGTASDFAIAQVPDMSFPAPVDITSPQEPPAKKFCRELTKEQELKRYAMCGEFLEERYQKKVKNGSVLFDELMEGNNRKKVSRCFHFILKKASEGRITVEQKEAYGPIRISKVNSRYSLEG